MAKKRHAKVFATDAEKRRAVSRVIAGRSTRDEEARKLGVSATAVGIWVRKAESVSGEALPTKPSVTKVRRAPKAPVAVAHVCPHCEGPLKITG